MQAVILFNLAVYVCHTYLDVRQLKAIKMPDPPAPLKKHTDPAEFKKTQSYQVDKWWFGLISGIWGEITGILTLAYFYMPFLWGVSTRLVAKSGLDPTNEMYVTIAFFLLDNVKDTLLGLPWSLYSTFVIEERHGFNKQTIGLYFADLLKGQLLTLAIAPPLLAAFVYILLHSGPYVALYLWAFVFVVFMVFMTVYPEVIAPLFNKFDTLPEGNLRQKIEDLAGSLRFPLKKLFVIDGSKRSAHSNAYMYGLFNNKRIVLYDTLVEQCDEPQVVAVLAHELGHWKLNHTLKNLGIIQFNVMTQFLLFTFIRNAPGLFESFGFTDVRPAFIAFTLFSAVSAPISEVVGFLMNVLSRMFEFQADEFAVKQGHGAPLKEALLKLDQKNRSSTNVDPWYSALHHSHPPLVQRLGAIDEAAKKTQ